jgi:hypothetical protein
MSAAMMTHINQLGGSGNSSKSPINDAFAIAHKGYHGAIDTSTGIDIQ